MACAAIRRWRCRRRSSTWTRRTTTDYRKLVSRAFTPGMVAGLEGRIRALARESLDAIRSGETHDFVEAVAVPLPMLVIAEMLGVAGRRSGDASSGGPMRSSRPRTPARRPSRWQHVGELFAYFHGKLGERRDRPHARPRLGARGGGDRRRAARGRRGPDVLHDAARRRQRDDAQPDLRRREGADGVPGPAPRAAWRTRIACRAPSRRCCAG